MILTEQQYKNLNRNYFHGAKTGKLEKTDSLYDYFYLTNSFVYAALYACSEDPLIGRVYRFTLKEGLNIFNAHSKKDVEKLRLYFFKNKTQVNKDWYWRGLEKEDWNCIFIGINRELFIEAIKNCGFDGFFNYEWTKKYKETFKIEKGERIPTAPAVGIFDITKLKQREIIGYKDYFKHRDFIEEYNFEKKFFNRCCCKSKRKRSESF